MKLSDIRGEHALDVLADLLDPAMTLVQDEEFLRLLDTNRMEAVKHAIKNHKKEVITILAVLDGENPETYDIGLLTLPIRLIQLISDKELVSLFQSQGRSVEQTSSGSATENTEVKKQ